MKIRKIKGKRIKLKTSIHDKKKFEQVEFFSVFFTQNNLKI